jgi:hypothetical protein
MRILPIILLALAAACSGGDSDVMTIEGAYTLESVGDTELPASHNGEEIVAGSLELREDATCERTTEFEGDEPRTEVDSCLWAGDPDELEVIWEDDRIYIGSLIASRLTLAGDESVWIYRR